MKLHQSLHALIICVLLFSSFALAQMGGNPRFSNLQIHVQVRYSNGASASKGIAITVEQEGSGVVAEGETDSQGKASFHIREAGFYLVRVKQPGFQTPAPQRVDLNTASSGYVMFDLKPLQAQGGSAIPAEGPGGQISANYSEKALEEYKQGENLLLKEQKIDASIEHLRKATKISKDFTDAYVMLGFAYLAQKNPQEAKPVLEKALKLDPKSWRAHIELGAVYNLEKRYPDAERELKAGLALNDKAAEGHYELAKTYWMTNRWQEAEPHVMKAIELAPNLSAAHVLYGNIKLRKHDYAGAKHEFEEYLRLEPNGPMAAASKDMIAKLNKASKANKP